MRAKNNHKINSTKLMYINQARKTPVLKLK